MFNEGNDVYDLTLARVKMFYEPFPRFTQVSVLKCLYSFIHVEILL